MKRSQVRTAVGLAAMAIALAAAPLSAGAASPWKVEHGGGDGHLHGIFAFDGCHIWTVGEALGAQSEIRASTDGGATWGAQAFPAGTALDTTMNRVLFTDVNQGYAAGEPNPAPPSAVATTTIPNFFTTSDGGATWVDRRPQLAKMQKASSLSDIEGLSAIGDSVWISIDGGQQQQQIGSPTKQAPAAIRGMIAFSPDRGLTWNLQKTSTTEGFSSIHMVTPSVGYVVTNMGHVYRTADGGGSWNKLSDPTVPQGATAVDFEQVWMADATHGAVVGSYADANSTAHALIVYTANGSTFTFAALPANANLDSVNDVVFVDATHGIAIGEQEGSVLVTSDGGSTWLRQASNTKDSMNGITATSSGYAWGAGSSSRIIGNTAPLTACPPVVPSPAVSPSAPAGATAGLPTAGHPASTGPEQFPLSLSAAGILVTAGLLVAVRRRGSRTRRG